MLWAAVQSRMCLAVELGSVKMSFYQISRLLCCCSAGALVSPPDHQDRQWVSLDLQGAFERPRIQLRDLSGGFELRAFT